MAIMNPLCQGGCCQGNTDEGCDNGMVRSAAWDEDTLRWVPVDYSCPRCNGTGHTAQCLEGLERDWEAFYSDDEPIR